MKKLGDILNNFTNKKIVVIGDIMLDEYINGIVERISPEAPVQIVSEKNIFYKPGGAGNVVSNLSSLGGKVSFFSFVGEDNDAEILKNILDKQNVDYFFGIDKITPKKTRVISNNQQLLRIDKENNYPKQFSEKIQKTLLRKVKESDMVVISDYAKGAVTSNLMNLLSDYKKKIIVNPKPVNKNLYSGVLLIIANENETFQMSGISSLIESGEKLKEEFNSFFLITQGERGMTLFSNGNVDIPTYAREVYDVQGAGDTVISAVSLAVCSGASLEEAALIGNYAAGIAVEKRGTYSVSREELEKRISGTGKKITTLSELEKIINRLRKENKKIVWTNGCFDLFHLGHKYSLEKAKEKGDILIVGLDSDESVRKLKGPERPICPQYERAEILSAIEFVDYVTIFNSGSVPRYLKTLKPDVFVKSKGYTLDTINKEEKRTIEEYGGEIFLLEGIGGLSTTNLIDKIKNNK